MIKLLAIIYNTCLKHAHLLWEQGVGGSNPSTPTHQKPYLIDIQPFFIEGLLFCQTDSINIKHIQKRDTDLRDTLRDTPLHQGRRELGLVTAS